MIGRWQTESVMAGLRSRRVVHLTGARQTGKTTLARSISLERSRLTTLDKALYLKAAKDDPSGFLNRAPGETFIIDEIQKVPSLLDEIKMRVDENDERGQYLLTGSTNLRFAKTIRDSLAGRMRTIRLRTLTSGELMSGKGSFIIRAFARDFESVAQGFGKRDIIHSCFVGGYPEAMNLHGRDRIDWFRDYLDDILMKDVRDVTEIRKLHALRNVAKWLLARTARFFVKNELCAKSQISKETVDGYISALTALYLFDEVEPWSETDYSRAGKRSKYFAADPGLVANLLGWKEDEVYYDDDRCGKIVETWAYRELSALADFTGGCEITQYRDSDKREIDFIIRNEAGDLLGVEVKSGSSIGDSDFTNLRWFRQNMAKTRFTGVVLHSGRESVRFGEGMFAVPLGMLSL